MYGVSFPMTDAEMKDDFLIPLGKARVDRVGTDVTLVAHSKAVGTCLEAAEVGCNRFFVVVVVSQCVASNWEHGNPCRPHPALPIPPPHPFQCVAALPC